MAHRSLGVSEARRRLPHLVAEIAADGGRVDVTRRGRPLVTIVRTSDLEAPRADARAIPAALAVDLLVPSETLVDVIRALRSRVGRPRRPPVHKSKAR
jgi:prevent-host-death family protein